jgi:hypothetical protein
MATALSIALAAVALSVTYVLYETDFWQHLLVGKAIWMLGHVPTRQLWSWSSYGDPEVNSAWLFRVIVWKAWSWGGVWGLQIYRWMSTLAAFALLWATARRMGARGFAALFALTVCVMVYRLRSQVRPETLASVFLALELWILETRRHGGPDRTAWIPVIALAWANTHVSYFLGFLLLGIHWLGAQTAAWRQPAAAGAPAPHPARLIVVGGIAFAASLLNPFGWRALWQPFDFFIHWRGEPMFKAIAELQHLPVGALLWSGVAFVLVAWPLLILLRARRLGFDLIEVVTCAIFAGLAWSSLRFLGYVSLVCVPYLARDIDDWTASRRWPAWTSPPWTRAGLVTAACLAFWLPAWTIGQGRVGVGIDMRYVPSRAVDFMAAEGIRGHGFNHFHFGGYMLYRFWPDSTRLPFATIHPEALRHEDRLGYEAGRTSRAGWRALDAKYHFDYALVYRKQLGGDRVLDSIDSDSTWALVFLDDVAGVYVRRDGPLERVARTFAYRAAPGGKEAIAAMGQAAARDSTLRSQAEAELARQIAGSPQNAMASSVLASFEMMDGRLAEADAHLRHALSLDPALPHGHERRGLIALQQGRPAEALREFESEVRAGTTTQGLQFSLGRTYRMLGDVSRAREHYRAELRYYPSTPGLLDSLRAIDPGAGS